MHHPVRPSQPNDRKQAFVAFVYLALTLLITVSWLAFMVRRPLTAQQRAAHRLALITTVVCVGLVLALMDVSDKLTGPLVLVIAVCCAVPWWISVRTYLGRDAQSPSPEFGNELYLADAAERNAHHSSFVV